MIKEYNGKIDLIVTKIKNQKKINLIEIERLKSKNRYLTKKAKCLIKLKRDTPKFKPVYVKFNLDFHINKYYAGDREAFYNDINLNKLFPRYYLCDFSFYKYKIVDFICDNIRFDYARVILLRIKNISYTYKMISNELNISSSAVSSYISKAESILFHPRAFRSFSLRITDYEDINNTITIWYKSINGSGIIFNNKFICNSDEDYKELISYCKIHFTNGYYFSYEDAIADKHDKI